MVTEEELRIAIQEHYPFATLDVAVDGTTGRLTGYIIWDGFREMAPDDRERDVWKWLWACLGYEATEIGRLYAVTLHEYRKHQRAH